MGSEIKHDAGRGYTREEMASMNNAAVAGSSRSDNETQGGISTGMGDGTSRDQGPANCGERESI